jgi:HEAT repeat protein
VLLAVGCVSDPRDPKTWIKQLGDPRESKEAVNQLVKLKDPEAVPPLIDFYKKSKDPDVLKAIASFKDKRQVPIMIESLDYSEDSYDNAATAAAALGDTPDPSAVEPLTKALLKPLPVKTRANIVKLNAMKSLVAIHDPKAVDALIKVLETPADDQDFYLNQVAAQSLGELGNPKAVPALIRGLFMTGRGADIFQPCRISLLQIGHDSIQPLIDAHQRKNQALEADAKKYEFRDGVIEQKTSLVLGDLRAKEALPVMLAELKKPKKGDNHTGALYAIGMIGDHSATKDVVGILTDGKRDFKVRISAAETLNFLGDPSSYPALLTTAKTGDVTQNGEKYPDVRLAAALAYARLGGPAEAAAFAPIAAAEKAAPDEFKQDMVRLTVGKECNKDVACYSKVLADSSDQPDNLAKQEKAAFMLGRLGKDSLPALTKKLKTNAQIIRIAVLWAISNVANKGSAEVRKALAEQIDLDKTKPPMKAIVEEMRAVQAEIAQRS